MKPEDYLSKNEISKVEQFCKDTVMLNAVKKVILEPVYLNGTLQKDTDPDPFKNFALVIAQQVAGANDANAEAGRRLMATSEGVQLVERGFQTLLKLKTPEKPKKDEGNPAE